MYFSSEYSSPVGELLIVSDGEALCGVWYKDQKHYLSTVKEDIVKNENLPVFDKVTGWFDDYFDGKNPQIDFKLNPQGTDFRMRVWKILSQIPYGESVTYGQIAQKLSKTMSAQAVGGAVGHNPIAIIIPCHRVMGAGGKLTGYAGGIERKEFLLKLEGIL